MALATRTKAQEDRVKLWNTLLTSCLYIQIKNKKTKSSHSWNSKILPVTCSDSCYPAIKGLKNQSQTCTALSFRVNGWLMWLQTTSPEKRRKKKKNLAHREGLWNHEVRPDREHQPANSRPQGKSDYSVGYDGQQMSSLLLRVTKHMLWDRHFATRWLCATLRVGQHRLVDGCNKKNEILCLFFYEWHSSQGEHVLDKIQ